jgi:hypothetical protein
MSTKHLVGMMAVTTLCTVGCQSESGLDEVPSIGPTTSSELVRQYAIAIDRKDYEAYRSLHTEDVEVQRLEFGTTCLPWLNGRYWVAADAVEGLCWSDSLCWRCGFSLDAAVLSETVVGVGARLVQMRIVILYEADDQGTYLAEARLALSVVEQTGGWRISRVQETE